MKFDPDSRLDTSQVSDVRGRGGGKMIAGGGGLGAAGLLIYILVQLLGGDGGSATDVLTQLEGRSLGGASSASDADNTALQQSCRTGADANARQDCRIVGVINSVQAFWRQQLGDRYQLADTTFFRDAINTGCGMATSEVGPFYCPADQLVYIDLGFYDELQQKFGAKGGPFAEAYIIAHEYGHHIQNLTGYDKRVRTREGENSDSVRLELQADCYGGMWAHYATQVADPSTGRPFIATLTQPDIDAGLDAAAKVGDDYIQKRFQGQVNPETWTHGSSQQRQYWFRVGLERGDLAACDTFAVRQP